MSLSHQDKEAQTLLNYFQQMLADRLDPPSAEAAPAQPAVPAAPAAPVSAPAPAPVEQKPTPALQPQPKAQEQERTHSLPTLERSPTQSLEQLLQSVEAAAAVQTEVKTEPETAAAVKTKTQTAAETETKTRTAVQQSAQAAAVRTEEQTVKAEPAPALGFDPAQWRNLDTLEEFQTLFFIAQGVRFAVPLIDLGGIFEYDKLTTLFGKPDWYLGMTDIRGRKINVVDTLRWVSPEAEAREEKYPYIIALGQSKWALGCDELEGNKTISRDAVKWRQTPGSRPWLAGIVKDQRCALLHVQALIALFDKGIGNADLEREFEQSA